MTDLPFSIASRRLRLRPTDPSDQPLLDRLAARKEVARFVGRMKAADQAVVCTILKGGDAIGQVAIVESPALEGHDVEILCALVQEAEDGGFAWEACQLLMVWYFAEFKPRRIIASVSVHNPRALKLAAKLGMTLLTPKLWGDELIYEWEPTRIPSPGFAAGSREPHTE